MAHFYGDMTGNRGVTTRMGSADSGIQAHLRGWNIGGGVRCFVDEDGNDCVSVDLTSGSRGSRGSSNIGTWCLINGRVVKQK